MSMIQTIVTSLFHVHNVAFYLWLVREARRHIIEGDFAQWKGDMVTRLGRRL